MANLERGYALRAGQLNLRIHRGCDERELFRIAERQNPKRGFLFVSTVLGRHIPVKPSLHRQVLRELAQGCRSQLLDGPAMVMGFAETAIGLGAGVAEEIGRYHSDTAYLATTRHSVTGRAWLAFTEDHSHAGTHQVLRPNIHPAWDPTIVERRTLVLVDDEMTTGNTMANLVAAISGTGLCFSRILLATLTDWSEGRAAALVRRCIGVGDVRTVSLLEGSWSWIPDPDAAASAIPALESGNCPVWRPESDQAHFGAPRLGITDFPESAVLPRLGIAPPMVGERVLVVGTGEHVWHPFRLAEELEAAGCCSAFCATTRSPIYLGDVIRTTIAFPDHFGVGVPMYLHNVRREDWQRIILMTETEIDGIDDSLKAALSPCEIIDGRGRVHLVGAPR